jgi:hypothetical protein
MMRAAEGDRVAVVLVRDHLGTQRAAGARQRRVSRRS